MQLVRNAQCPCCESRESAPTIQHTLFECPAFAKERDTFLERLYELHPIARGLSPEGHCAFLMAQLTRTFYLARLRILCIDTLLLFRSSGWAS